MTLDDGKAFEFEKTFFSFNSIYSHSICNRNNVSSLLNKAVSCKSNAKGLELLSTSIEGLPLDVILENAFLWLNATLSVNQDSLKEIKLTIIGITCVLVFTLYSPIDFCR